MSFCLKIFVFALFIFYSSPLRGIDKPLSIVIIGGGPAGLGAAIEAKMAGADVTIVEKRKQHTREQYFFLTGLSVSMLENWNVTIKDFYLGYDDIDHDLVGISKIKDFEEGLENRVKELGIPIIRGEFKAIKNRKAIIQQNDQEIEMAYDLLVGADGEHSVVRKELGIQTRHFGKAVGLIAILDKKNPTLNFVLPFWSTSLFINKVCIPSLTIISGQAVELSKEQLAEAALREGWSEEAGWIKEGKGIFFENISINLQQALTFSDQEKSAILIGDATAAASFLQGLGANCSLEAVKIAGHFFTTERNEQDYATYNQKLKEITDRLISESLVLFK